MPFCRLLLQWMVVLLPKLDVNKYLVTVCFLAFSLMPIVFDSLSDIIKSTSLTRYFTFSSENRALSLALPWPPRMRWVPVLSLWYCAPSPGSFLRTSSSWLSFQFSILTLMALSQHPLNILKVFLWIVKTHLPSTSHPSRSSSLLFPLHSNPKSESYSPSCPDLTSHNSFENWVSFSCMAALLSARPVVPSFLSGSMECSQLAWLLSPQCWQLTYWNPSTTLVGRQEMVSFRLCPFPVPISAVLLFYLDFLTNSFSLCFLSLCPF